MELEGPIGRGATADIYLHQGTAVKVFHSRLPDGAAEAEAAGQRVAYACGLPVPRVIDVIRVHGRQAIQMEYIPGESLGELLQQNPTIMAMLLEQSVALQIQVQAQSGAALEPLQTRLARQLEKAESLGRDTQARLRKRLAGLPVQDRLCHGDYHVYNLIRSADRTVIIDWADASAGNPCADACRSYLLSLPHSRAWAERYLQLYCERGNRSRDDVLVWVPIVAGARLAESIPSENEELLRELIRQSL